MIVDKLAHVPPYWREQLRRQRRAYFTSKAMASHFRDTCCTTYIISSPLTADWQGPWVVFYY